MVWEKPDEPLTEYERDLIRPKTITIPLVERLMIREAGDLLAHLGHAMKLHSHRDLTRKQLAAVVRGEIDEVNRKIREYAEIHEIDIPRRGRRPSKSSGSERNESETTEIVSLRNPLNLYNRKVR